MTKRFAFVLTNEFTLTPFALFIDTLRLAGDEADRSRRIEFDWQILGTRGLPIRSSCGVQVLPTAEGARPSDFDYLVLVGGLLRGSRSLPREHLAFLEGARAAGKPIVGLCTASFTLAEHGLLDGYDACLSWLHLQEFQTAYPYVQARADKLFLIDRDRITCAGGAGAADLAATLVAEALGERQAAKAADILLLDRVRTHRDLQPNKNLFGKVDNVIVRKALLAMQDNCIRPLQLQAVASRASCSVRQLERLFSNHLRTTPRQAYMTIRIERSKSLIMKSGLPMSEIAHQCGFMNASHFARTFKEMVGIPPSKFSCEARS